jgi:hypothetical protein
MDIDEEEYRYMSEADEEEGDVTDSAYAYEDADADGGGYGEDDATDEREHGVLVDQVQHGVSGFAFSASNLCSLQGQSAQCLPAPEILEQLMVEVRRVAETLAISIESAARVLQAMQWDRVKALERCGFS